jgi:hypothetical protein
MPFLTVALLFARQGKAESFTRIKKDELKKIYLKKKHLGRVRQSK